MLPPAARLCPRLTPATPTPGVKRHSDDDLRHTMHYSKGISGLSTPARHPPPRPSLLLFLTVPKLRGGAISLPRDRPDFHTTIGAPIGLQVADLYSYRANDRASDRPLPVIACRKARPRPQIHQRLCALLQLHAPPPTFHRNRALATEIHIRFRTI